MTTPLLPTKTQLTEATYTPKELYDDGVFESWLINPRGNYEALRFVVALMTAYRAGKVTSVTYQFTIRDDAVYLASVIGLTTKYDYTVVGPGEPNTPTERTVTVSWA